jgi:hypothetical protein
VNRVRWQEKLAFLWSYLFRWQSQDAIRTKPRKMFVQLTGNRHSGSGNEMENPASSSTTVTSNVTAIPGGLIASKVGQRKQNRCLTVHLQTNHSELR